MDAYKMNAVATSTCSLSTTIIGKVRHLFALQMYLDWAGLVVNCNLIDEDVTYMTIAGICVLLASAVPGA